MLLGARVLVVVPAYDEAPRIVRVLRSMPAFVDRVVVVDDASGDDTAARARAVDDPRIEVMVHPTNRGVGSAIASGYRHALTIAGEPNDAFAVMAGDGQMDPDDLHTVVEPVARGEADYVKGNRFLAPDVARAMPASRRLGGLAFSWLTARATGLPISDSQCGYTALGRAACETLDLDGLWHGFGYPNDLLGQLAVRKLRVAEVAVRPVYADEKSKLRLWHVPVIAGLVARAWARRLAAQRGHPPHAPTSRTGSPR
jgi:glycosyltransferase involved in cell wall biosynthesis